MPRLRRPQCLPFDAPTRERLQALKLPPGTSVVDPIEDAGAHLQERTVWVAGEILDVIA